MPYKYLTHDDVNDLGLKAAQRADPDGKPWDYPARLESALNEQETAGWRVVSIQWNDQGEIHSALLHQKVVHGEEPLAPSRIY
jgi:hypothetical protein